MKLPVKRTPLEGAMGGAHELGLVNAYRRVKVADQGTGGLADADNADLALRRA